MARSTGRLVRLTGMAYRDDTEALTARCAELERDLAALDRRRAELNALSGDAASLRRELASLQRLLKARGGRSLPVLEDVRVASPCNAEWSDMTGDDRVRFCGECRKNVYNLSSLTRAQAESLIRSQEGEVCVRLYRRADGTVLTADCAVGARRLRFRRAAIVTAGAGILALGAAFAAASVTMGKREVVMGQMQPAPTVQYTQPAVTPGDPLVPEPPTLGRGRWEMGGPRAPVRTK